MNRFSHIGILVKDLQLMRNFYIDVFDMKVVWHKENEKSYLTTGNGDIVGFQVDDTLKPVSQIKLNDIDNAHGHTPNFFHFGTVTESPEDYHSLRDKLVKMDIKVSENKVSRDKSESFYCLDPEGNCIQICYVPEGYFEQSLNS